ncbi:substrate-binding domain-containing protein [Vibrio salinus]|uniref:substrate-binding domain-containing protein n=1 Tax=Vibrio salinus TaxID=2899784 RepID=UPI001E3D8BB9|nr:substrate-binding domain-containing protein [Vibrio salinus]MCE0493710.1 substrate-binding domain-containing protein [Vibrio salinus]
MFVALVFSVLSFQVSAKFIAVSVSSEDNFKNLIAKKIEKTVDLKGDDVYIDTAHGDFNYQYEQVKKYIAAGADAIIILSAGDYKQNEKLIALSSKVPLVFVNVEPIKDLSKLPPRTVYVGSNELESGTMQMEELAKLAGYEGNVAILRGPDNAHAAKIRTLDVQHVMEKYPKLKLLKSESANWARNQAYKIVDKWIKSDIDFKVLVANNDEMAVGGIMALRDAGKDVKSYLIGGIDATPDALSEMQKGNLDVTVFQDASAQGITAVNVAYKLMNNTPVDSVVWVPFKLVTPTNLDQYTME